jgi:acyl carrier protein
LATLSALELEIGHLIIEALHLDGMEEDDIDPQAALFGEGLGLDSIDALELSLAVSQRYGVTISSQDPNIRTIFSSLSALCAYIAATRTR